MKKLISRSPFKRLHGTLAVYLEEGAPLTDAVWNESSDLQWATVRNALVDSGVHGTAGLVLKVEPLYDGESEIPSSLRLRGGVGSFYCAGLPISWHQDVNFDQQRCACVDQSVGEMLDDAGSQPIFTWVEARMVFLDETDRPQLRDPAIQFERGSFRRVLETCVKVASARSIPGTLVPSLKSIEAVASALEGFALPEEPSPTNVHLTVQGAYADDENVHYAVELVGVNKQLDTYTVGVEVLWDDRAASTVARLVSDAAVYEQEIEVDTTEGFEPGHFIRLEGTGTDGQIYQITRVEAYKIEIRRAHCCEVVSLEGVPIIASQASLGEVTLLITGGCDLVVDQLVTNFGGDDSKIAHRDLAWKITDIGPGSCDSERVIKLVPFFGFTQDLSPFGEPLALMRHARIHEYCLSVEDTACWQPGMRVKISGKPRAVEPDDPCWQPEDLDVGHECWPSREPLFRDETRTISWIERCGAIEQCCDEDHTVMTLRLDMPLAADHSKCCDEVRPLREIKVRRYAGHLCCVKLQALWPCCEDTGGICCLEPSFTLPSGLEVVLTYRGGTQPIFQPGDSWNFAARAGGWYEAQVFAPPLAVIVGMSPLAMLLPAEGDKTPTYTIFDIRPVPASYDQSGYLHDIHQSCEELASYYGGWMGQTFAGAAMSSHFPRLQANVSHGSAWQYGLAELLYRIARVFVWSSQNLLEGVDPDFLATNKVLNVAFRALANVTSKTRHKPALTNGELAVIARNLARIASTTANILGGCCGNEEGELMWPPLVPLTLSGPWKSIPGPELPVCPDEPDPEPNPEPEPEPMPEIPPDPRPEPEPEPMPEIPPDPRPEPEPEPMPEVPPDPRPEPEPEPMPEIPPDPRPEPEPEPMPEIPPDPRPEPEPMPEIPPDPGPEPEPEPMPEIPPGPDPDPDPDPEIGPNEPEPPEPEIGPYDPGPGPDPEPEPGPEIGPSEPPEPSPELGPYPGSGPDPDPDPDPDPEPVPEITPNEPEPPPEPEIAPNNPEPEPNPGPGIDPNVPDPNPDPNPDDDGPEPPDSKPALPDPGINPNAPSDSPEDTSIGGFPELGDTDNTLSDIGITDIYEPETGSTGLLLTIWTDDILIVREKEELSQLPLLWPQLADVYGMTADDEPQQRLITAVNLFINELLDLVTRTDTPVDQDAIERVWHKHIRAGVQAPSLDQLMASLEALSTPEGE